MIKTDHYGIPTNHIQKLELKLKQRNGAVKGMNEGLQHLIQYLYSKKFYYDGSVNIDDVINRIRDAQFLSSEEEHSAGQDYLG